MHAETRGRTNVIVVIAFSLSIQVVGSAIALGWGSSPDRDELLHHYFGIPLPQRASLPEVAANLLVAVVLCWALYAGYRWARWFWVFLYAVVLGFIGFSVISTGPVPLAADGWSLLMVLFLGAAVVCLAALLLPSTGSFLRSQRMSSSQEGPAP